jgi:O-antigen ligase
MIRLKQLIEKYTIFEKLLISIAITIPFWMLFNNIAIICSLLFSVIVLLKSGKEHFRLTIITKLFMALFLIMSFSILYSSNLEYAYVVLNRITLFIVLPFIVLVSKPYLKRNFVERLLGKFIFACFTASLICLLNALYNTYQFGAFNPFNKENGNFFSYFNLTSILKIHPIYFGIYLLLSCRLSKMRVFGYLVLITFFITIILLLNSFMLIIASAIIFGLLFYKAIKFSIFKKFKKSFFYMLILILPFYFASNFIFEKAKGVHLVEDISSRDFTGSQFTAVKARVAKAYCSIDLIKDNPLLGVGIGDGNDELLKYYLKNGFKFGYDEKYNSHNQFLTIFINTGIFGFLILAVLISYLFYSSFVKSNYYLLFFIILNMCFFMTESVLERQNGIVFFVFFSSLLTIHQKSNVTLQH